MESRSPCSFFTAQTDLSADRQDECGRLLTSAGVPLQGLNHHHLPPHHPALTCSPPLPSPHLTSTHTSSPIPPACTCIIPLLRLEPQMKQVQSPTSCAQCLARVLLPCLAQHPRRHQQKPLLFSSAQSR
jgi:hypothetical protein